MSEDLMSPLYGAGRCEVYLHRRLIETWVWSLHSHGDGNAQHWCDQMAIEFGCHSHKPYLPLGRALLLAWGFHYGIIQETFPFYENLSDNR